jgi:CheY-like chemotaxis protein
MADAQLPPIQIILAASDPVEIDRIRSSMGREFPFELRIVENYLDLLASITQSSPQLVILGKIDNSNYLNICQSCHKIQANLPIILLSSQEIISDSFRQLVKNCGLTDVITKDLIALNQLLQKLVNIHQPPTNTSFELMIDLLTEQSFSEIDQFPAIPTADNFSAVPLIDRGASPAEHRSSEPEMTGQMMLTGLQEIVAISSNYFGTLAQGNYWRKAHGRIAAEFPLILNWSADHFGNISCDESSLERQLTAEDLQALRIWVKNFIGECERIIIDFGIILNNADLSASAKDLLTKP